MDLAVAEPVDYINDRGRERDTPAGQRKSDRVLEDVHALAGRRKHDAVHRLRRILGVRFFLREALACTDP